MDKLKIIKEFFKNVKCSQCNNFFTGNSVQLVREEENNIVIKVICHHCSKNLGLVIIGIDPKDFLESMKIQGISEEDEEEILDEFTIREDPITFEDVINAHKFFNSLGSDWMKHLPKVE
jgi:hypothetical protein